MEENESNYIVWQNRALRFYLGARLLSLNEQYSPSAFCSLQAIELLMKATLIYWDKSFDPESNGHKMKGMINAIKNKAKEGKDFECPDYFHQDNRFQSVSRYPVKDKGKGIVIPATLLSDLDDVFYNLVKLVPFQDNSELKRVLSGKNKKDLKILRKSNSQMACLRKYLNIKLRKSRLSAM